MALLRQQDGIAAVVTGKARLLSVCRNAFVGELFPISTVPGFMRWRSGLIASVIIGNSCLRSGSRDPDLQDRMTHTLLTVSPRVEPYWCAPRPPPRAIARRFRALAQSRTWLDVRLES